VRWRGAASGGGTETEQQERLGEKNFADAFASHCWREQKMHCSLATVHARQMEVCLFILPLVVGLRLRSENFFETVRCSSDNL
jgi:hypothetical protein